MKKLPAILIFVLFFANILYARSDEGVKRALLIGVNEYLDPSFHSLQTTTNDVNDLAAKLETIGFARENIVIMSSAVTSPRLRPSRQNILNQLQKIQKDCGSNDVLFIVFTGHGLDGGYYSYFCADDTQKDDFQTTGIRLEDEVRKLSDCNAIFKWVVVDACRDTAKGASEPFHLSQPPEGVVLFQSCSSGETSQQADKHGLFMEQFLSAFEPENSDSNHDGKLSFQEICDYTKRKTREVSSNQQNPTLDYDGEYEDFIVCFDTIRMGAEKLIADARLLRKKGDYKSLIEAQNKMFEVVKLYPNEEEYRDFLDLLRAKANEETLAILEKTAKSRETSLFHVACRRGIGTMLDIRGALEDMKLPFFEQESDLEVSNHEELEQLQGWNAIQELNIQFKITNSDIEILKSFSNLKKLNTTIDSDLTWLKNFPAIESMFLFGDDRQEKEFTNLKELVYLPNLKEIHFGEAITDSGLKNLVGCHTLESITIYGGKNITSTGLQYLTNLPNLEYLDLSMELTDECWKYLKEMPRLKNFPGKFWLTNSELQRLKDFPAIEELDFSCEKVTREGLRYLKEFPHLKKLRLRNATDSDLKELEGLEYLEELSLSGKIRGSSLNYLSKIPNLKYLSCPEIIDSNFHPIAKLKKLEILELRESGITDSEIHVLQDLINLKELSLNGNNITDEGLKYISILTKLETLILDNTKVTDWGLEHLSSLQNLKNLGLCNTLTNGSGSKYLKDLFNLKEISINPNKQENWIRAMPQCDFYFGFNLQDIFSRSRSPFQRGSR